MYAVTPIEPMDADLLTCRVLSLLLRRAARDHLGLQDGDYWPSDVADAQARAAIKAGWTCVTVDAEERLIRIRRFAESKARSAKAVGVDERPWLAVLILCGGPDA